MTTPATDLVQVSQSALDNYAAAVEAALAVIKPYIASLVAGQAVPLKDADVTALTAAVSDLDATEPPAPAPVPPAPAGP
jgi:hypothetical protein